ncbi:hypothetical protein [Xanthobacter variabilis]|uniref:hypothetical protein n=1 Tax=Xanthobacter variabilis TaxID=3119932 RepID=UPI00372B2A47
MPTNHVRANAPALPAVTAFITDRRNFLVRALGFTAAGAALAVPVVAMETPEQRIRHHMKGLEQAFADYYGAHLPITPTFNGATPQMLRDDPTKAAYAIVRAGPRLYPDARTIYHYDDGPLFAEDR